MSTNFTAIIDHNFSPQEVAALHDRLNDARLGIHDAMARYHAALDEPSSAAGWIWQPDHYESTTGISPAACWLDARGYELRYPLNWSLAVCRRACDFSGGLRWQRFLAVASIHEATRELCRAMARALGSPRVLYLPDSDFRASAALDLLYTSPAQVADLVAWLEEHGVVRGELRVFAADPVGPDPQDKYYLEDLADATFPVWNAER